jgi:hypothetical protein
MVPPGWGGRGGEEEVLRFYQATSVKEANQTNIQNTISEGAAAPILNSLKRLVFALK